MTMADLRELAAGYRIAAAKLAMRIREKEERGDPPEDIRKLRGMLADLREVQRCLDGYYDIPRPSEITMSNMRARGPSHEDH